MMRSPKILDSYAIISYFEDEVGAEQVQKLLLRAEAGEINLFMTILSLGEVWFSIAKTDSLDSADAKIKEIREMPIEIVDADWFLAREAACVKVKSKLPYSDCFVVALAKLKKAELVTANREFKKLEGEIKIAWL